MTDRQAFFIFTSPEAARLFVKRLVLMLDHVAIYIRDEGVIVIDGAEEPQGERIRQLARTSGSITIDL